MTAVTPRLRGRRGVERRKRVLMREPVCRMCKAEGRYRPTDELDHIVPLHRGGADDESNLQGLCFEHHAAKTAAEAGGRVSNHPEWLERSRIPLTIVCGPPCSGKSTHVARNAAPGDVVIDLDGILAELDPAYSHWSEDDDFRDLLDEAIRIRNRRLGELSRSGARRAWFIIAAPTAAERQWWKDKLGGEVLLLNPGPAECRRRAIQRGTPAAIEGIARWERNSRLPWRRPRQRAAIGADGWPVNQSQQ